MAFRIELKNVSFGYEGSIPIVKNMNLAAYAGEVQAIVTPVGGGKSTLLKICAGLIVPDEGDLIINGQFFWELPILEQNEIRRRMGFDFQEGALIANMNVFDNLALSLRYHDEYPEREIKKQIDGWLECLDLLNYRNNLPAALSMGLRRRVSFIRSMLLGRDFFFFDEPTQDADPKFSKIVTDTILGKKREGAGVIVTTQSGTFLKSCADKAVVVADGKTLYCGDLKEGRIPVDISAQAMLRE